MSYTIQEAFRDLNKIEEKLITIDKDKFNDYKTSIDDILVKSNDKSHRFDKDYILDRIEHDEGWVEGIVDNDHLHSVAFMQKNKLGIDDNYVAFVSSAKRGSGRELVNELFNKYDNIWLMCDPGNDNLLSYYKSFGFDEYIIDSKESPFEVDTHFFYKSNNPYIEDKIKERFSEE